MIRYRFLASLAVCAVIAGGCGSIEPEDPDLIGDRLRPGPGLLSGARGEFVLIPGTPEATEPRSDRSPES